MNETLKPYVEKLLNSGMKTAEDVLKFVEVQTPELMNEMLLWGAVSELSPVIFGFLLFASATVIHFACRKVKSYYECYEAPPPFVGVFIAWVLGATLFIVEIFDVLYPLIAPRLYILEKISSFIK